MSDQFGTRPGGEQGEATGGGHIDDRPVDEAFDTGGGAAVAAGTFHDDALDGNTFDDARGDEESSEVPGGPAPLSPVPSWVGAASAAGLALVAIQALVMLGTISQGLAVERFEGDLFHKIGVAVLSNVGSANGLMIVVGAVVAALPAMLGARQQELHVRRQALAFGIGAVVAILLVIATPIAVRARIFVIDAGGQTVDALARRVLATYVAGTLGSALVALGTCLAFSRYSKTVSPRP